MAHETQITGKLSEITAMRALISNGFEVSLPSVAEVYDMIARDPLRREYHRVQVKTARVREDRDGAIVIYARKGNGQPYTKEDCDWIVGVLGDTVYLMECNGNSEYWATETSASKRWIELTATNNVEEAV